MNHARSVESVYGARPLAQCQHCTVPVVTDFLQIAQFGIFYSPSYVYVREGGQPALPLHFS